jgi:membrane associated rhomboid family serine protease
MLVLFSFGMGIEYYFRGLYHSNYIRFSPWIYYLALYISAIIISALSTINKYKNIYAYNAVGASGAISAVLFACIFFDPWQKLLFWAIIPIPGILFGLLYLWYSHYMSRHSNDSINHEAHFFGALYGITFPVLLHPPLLYAFFEKLIHLPL